LGAIRIAGVSHGLRRVALFPNPFEGLNAMSYLERLKGSWLYAIAITAVSTSAITWGVVQVLVLSPMREDYARQSEELQSLKKTLNLVKSQYDIPESTIADFFGSVKEKERKPDFQNLAVLESPDLIATVQTVIRRNKTSQIQYPGFSITIATSEVDQNGRTTFNVGYTQPNSEIRESLQFNLHPAQTMIVQNESKVLIFQVTLVAADPFEKSALVEVTTLSTLKELFPSNNKN
jgi:ribosomal protein S16